MYEQQKHTPEHHDNTAREQEYLQTGRFFENYEPELKELFNILEWEWSEDPSEVNAQLKQLIGRDHLSTEGLQKFTADQEENAMLVVKKMGLLEEMLPPEPTTYDDTVVLGATTMAIKRRLAVRSDVLEAGSTTRKTTLLNGQRPRSRLDKTNDEILDLMGVDPDNPWAARELDKGEEAFPTETELGRAAVLGIAAEPMAQAYRMDLPIIGTNAAKHEAGSAPRDITDYYYKDGEDHEIVVVNGRAIGRGEDTKGNKRDPRPTTMSTIEEWIERHTPEEHDKVLFIVSQPHALRMGRKIIETLKEHGLDIKIDIASASAPATTKVHTALGEIARMVDREQRQKQSSSE